MNRYEIYLFLHVASVITWVGGGLGITIQGYRADRARDAGSLKRIVDEAGALSTRVFIPASLATLLSGS